MISELYNFTSHHTSHAPRQAHQAETNTIWMVMWFCDSATLRHRPSSQCTLILEASACSQVLWAKVKLTRRPCRGGTTETEIGLNMVAKSCLRIILDASTRRFQAHKIYLRAAAATRWVQLRTELFRREKIAPRIAIAMRVIDQRLQDVSGSIFIFISDYYRHYLSLTFFAGAAQDHR